jgi:hypothetical protein
LIGSTCHTWVYRGFISKTPQIRDLPNANRLARREVLARLRHGAPRKLSRPAADVVRAARPKA